MIKGFEDFYFIYLLNRQYVATTMIWGIYRLRKREERGEVKKSFEKTERHIKLLKIKVHV